MVADSATRVNVNTDREVNERIRRDTQTNIEYYAQHPELIDGRLKELDQEWDVERWLQVNSAALSLLGLFMALTRGRHWLILPIAVQSLFAQHGIQGWCPPLPVFRRMGVRTEPEIQAERYALKAIRGDFENAADTQSTMGAVSN